MVLALGLSPWLACHGEPERSVIRWHVVPVSAFNNFADGEVSIEGPISRSWRRWGETLVPAVTAGNGTILGIPVAELSGARVRGGYALGVAPVAEVGLEGTFRISAATAAGDRRVVFEDRMTFAEQQEAPRPLDVLLPDDLVGSGKVSFELSLPEGPARAYWLDPEIALPQRLPPAPRGAPNVLFVTSDTTRQDALGLYGGGAATPALERLAADGIRLDRMYSVGFGTLPSHCSLFTGSHPRHHGIYDNATVLRPELTTLAEVLRDAGYETAAFVGSKPVARSLGLDQGFLRYDDVFAPDSTSHLGGFAAYERRADRTTDRFLRWLDSTEGGPFAAWVHYFDPHQPYAPAGGPPQGEPAAVTRVFREADGGPTYLEFNTAGSEIGGVPVAEVGAAAERRYQAEIETIDRQLGRLLEELERRGVYDDTLIVFVSDHGENFLDRGAQMAYRHRGLFTQVALLAAVVKLPGARQADRVTDILTANADLACLALDVAALDAPADWECRSFLPHLVEAEGGRPFRPYLVLEGAAHHEIAVRTPRWNYREAMRDTDAETLVTLGYEDGARVQLFDLRADPGEHHNLAAAPEHRAEVARLHELARRFQATGTAESGRSLESQEHLESLKALGYLE